MAALTDKQHAHELIERVPPDQITAAVRFLEFLLLDALSRALATAPIDDDQVEADLGFTVEQIEPIGPIRSRRTRRLETHPLL